MRTLQENLKQYNQTYAPGECRSREYEARIKQEKRLHIKLDLADTMFNEIPYRFTKPQKQQVKTLIRTFPNFKDLHSKATYEEIILSFIFYVKALETKKLTLNKTLIDKFVEKDKQTLYPRINEIIHWKITLHYIQKQPILPIEPDHIDHNILYKG